METLALIHPTRSDEVASNAGAEFRHAHHRFLHILQCLTSGMDYYSAELSLPRVHWSRSDCQRGGLRWAFFRAQSASRTKHLKGGRPTLGKYWNPSHRLPLLLLLPRLLSRPQASQLGVHLRPNDRDEFLSKILVRRFVPSRCSPPRPWNKVCPRIADGDFGGRCSVQLGEGAEGDRVQQECALKEITR